MTQHRPSSIEAAPSLADITSARDRVGKVDFTARLGDRMDARRPDETTALRDHGAPPDTGHPSVPSPRPAPPAAGSGAAGPSAAPLVREARDVDELAAGVARLTARADRTRAAEVLRLLAEAEAGRLDDPADDATDGSSDLDHGDHGDLGADGDDLDHDLDDYFAAYAAGASAAELAERADHHTDAPADGSLRTVTEVAGSVIAAMQRINQAHERHVEALELETARRCELLTAQAELDAELIRLTARREAHAIISAARTRTSDYDAEQGATDERDTDELVEIGETFSRFAETIEITVAKGPEPPDQLRRS